MKVFKRMLLYLCVYFTLLSCNNTDSTALEEKYYNLEKIGWKSKIRKQNVGKLNYTAVDVPLQYYVLKDLGADNLSEVESIYEKNVTDRIIEFTYDLTSGGKVLDEQNTGLNFDESYRYLAFNLENDFRVVTSQNDTIICSGVTYDRNYNIVPYERVLLFFSGVKPDEKIQLIYDDNLFRNGRIKFQFNEPYTKILL